MELELYDKVFLQKKDIIKLHGKLLLEQVIIYHFIIYLHYLLFV